MLGRSGLQTRSSRASSRPARRRAGLPTPRTAISSASDCRWSNPSVICQDPRPLDVLSARRAQAARRRRGCGRSDDDLHPRPRQDRGLDPADRVRCAAAASTAGQSGPADHGRAAPEKLVIHLRAGPARSPTGLASRGGPRPNSRGKSTSRMRRSPISMLVSSGGAVAVTSQLIRSGLAPSRARHADT
jgi:hypothetical protein